MGAVVLALTQCLLQCGIKVRGEVRPRTGHEGPEGEYSYSSTISLTSVLDAVGG